MGTNTVYVPELVSHWKNVDTGELGSNACFDLCSMVPLKRKYRSLKEQPVGMHTVCTNGTRSIVAATAKANGSTVNTVEMGEF